MDSPSASSAVAEKSGKRKQQTTVKARNKTAAEKKQAGAGGRAGGKISNNSYVDNSPKKVAVVGMQSEEENNLGSTDQVNIILSKLGSELQQRMKAKRQRLESCFDSVRATPNSILETLNSHTEERTKMIEGFRSNSNKILQDIENVLSLQAATEDKFSKMMLVTQKHFDQIKDALNTTVTGLIDAINKFANETDTLETKHDEESKQQLQKIQQELGVLQKKILIEGQQEEAENIKTTLQLV